MVSTELYVAGLKRKEMVEITHGSSVDGSRGTRYRLYGTYTDPETKKIHKANSFVSKAKYDEITAKMAAGMPVADMTIEKVEVFAEESPADAEPSDLGGPTEPDNAGVPADVGGDEPVPMGDEPSDIQEFEGEDTSEEDAERVFERRLYGGASQDPYLHDEDPDAAFEMMEEIDEAALYEYEMEQERLRNEEPAQAVEEDIEITPVDLEEEVVVEEPRRPEPGTWAGVALDMAMISDDDDDFDWDAWKDEMKESRGAEAYEAYRKRAEMTLREWGESELEEEKHDFTRNPNESFREWLDEEVRAHGDISFREWADEEETEETKSAETVTKSAESDQDTETVDTQVAVALGIPPEIWRDTSRDKQDAYIASMMLDVTTVRDLADDGEFELIMAMANEQKETVTAGDLSLIECNVCGITASQLLDDLGGVCDITDPNGGANPNWVRGVSCPFEKYYSLTRAVYDEVEDELRDSRTVVQIHTPRPATAMAAESVSKRASRYARVGRTFNGRGYRKYRTESLMDITKDTSLGDFTSKELTESSAIQGDFDHASLNYSGRQNIQARAESFQADLEPQWHKRTHPDNPNRFYYSKGHRREYTEEDKKHGAYGSRLGRDGVWNELQNKRGMGFDNHTGELVKLPLQYYDDFMNNSETDAETFQADDFGDMEYVILVMLTDEQLEEEYGDFMRDEGVGRKELPQRLQDRYRTADEAQYLREKYLDDDDDDYDAETFRAYDDAISDRQRYKIQELGGKVDSSMNRSEASDYIKELQGRESGTWKSADTFQADSWDDLYVVAENQMGGWEACDVTDGVLQTYANQADAEREAQMTIDDLNSMGGDYSPTSWAGKRLSEVDVADDVEFIRYPNGLEAPYDEVHQGRSMNDPITKFDATRGIDTFTEPFEDEERSNWLLAAGIAGVFALGAWLLPKGD